MANIFHIDRPTNKITLGTDATTIVVTPLTASKPLALNASKELESVVIGTSLSYVRPTLNTIQDIQTTASPTFAGLTLTNAAVIGSNSVVFQPGTDSTTFFQVLDADGGTPIFNMDTTNERVGIGTISPYSGLHYQGDIFYLTPAAGPESNDNITIKNYATGNGAPDIILRTADIAGAYGIGVGTLSLIGGSKTTHYGGIGHGGGKISLQGGQGRDAANDPSYYAPVLLQPTGGNVGIGTTAPNAPLEVKGAKPGIVGGWQSGQLQVTGSGGEFYNSVITGHNSLNGNTQLWYLGNTSSGNNDVAFINRQNAAIHFYTNNTSRMTIDAAGNVTLATIVAEGSDVDKFLVSSSGVVKYRTGTQVLSDIGGQASGNYITALTGEVTASGPGSVAATIAANAVTYAKIQNVSATDKVLGRATAGAGVVEEIACTAAGRAILAGADAAAQKTTLSLNLVENTALSTWAGTANITTLGTITTVGNITIAGNGTIGQAAGPLLAFDDTNNYLEITGCKVGIGTATPSELLEIAGAAGDGAAPITLQLRTLSNITYTLGSEWARIDFVSDDTSGDFVGGETRARIAAVVGNITGTRIDLVFSTINVDTVLTEQMRIDYAGNVGIGLTIPKTKLTVEGTITLKEQAAADGDTAAYGQDWVKTAAPCQRWFTDDTGIDYQLSGIATGVLNHSFVYDPPEIANGAEASTGVTVTGAAFGDFVLVSFSANVFDLVFTGEVTSENIVTVVLANNTGAARDLASGTVYIRVLKK